MFNLKSFYFYFLAIKIKITEFFKKIYFTTNYYNKSLKSKIPNQFYFYPNPFLLSSFTNYKNFLFKVENINPETLWNKKFYGKNEKHLHDFFWLNLIDRKNDAIIIQKIISIWICKNNNYRKIIWDNTVLSKRIISWILNADIILNNADNVFKDNFLQSIVMQINHLKKNIKFQNDYSKKIEIISAILLSGLVFKEYSNNFDLGLKELKRLTENFFDEEGFPVNRNPNDLIKLSKYLILIKECSKDAQSYIPDYLDEIIEKNLTCLVSIKTSNDETPLFNGNNEAKIDDYLNYIKNFGDAVVFAGPTSTDDGETITGSVFIIELENLTAAEEFSQGDPYRKMGLFESIEIEQVRRVIPEVD